MAITRKTLLKTVPLERGELYSTVNRERLLLARCSPKLEIYENETQVAILGREQGIKKTEYSLVICYDTEFTRNVDNCYLSSISAFDLKAQIQRTDGVFEVINFNNITPTGVWGDENWMFDVNIPENLRKILGI